MRRVLVDRWRVWRMAVLLLHGMGAAGWIWLMPRGFGVGELRFWSNSAIPVVVVAAVVVALAGWMRGRRGVMGAVLLGIAAVWGASAVMGWVVFPVSLAWKCVIPMAIGAGVAVVVPWRAMAVERREMGAAIAIAIACGAAAGVVLPMSQKAPPATTIPGAGIGELPDVTTTLEQAVVRLNGTVYAQPASGVITVQRDRYAVWIEPLLTFISRSPDGCWTSLASRSARVGPPRRLTAAAYVDGALRVRYVDDGQSGLVVRSDGAGAVEATAVSQLPGRIDSHLNTFCQLTIAGHRRLSVSFSPCPDARIEVKPVGYPVGLPARIAIVDADARFRVVEATSGEKGPYVTLAEGRLARGEPLTITFYDDDRLIGELLLEDWSSQVSTARSPTAGWGLPQNAIEFSLSGDAPSSAANVFITLASTSVGRGWDSVGHAPGTYRNRMTFSLLRNGQ